MIYGWGADIGIAVWEPIPRIFEFGIPVEYEEIVVIRCHDRIKDVPAPPGPVRILVIEPRAGKGYQGLYLALLAAYW